jgi:DNA helicase-4
MIMLVVIVFAIIILYIFIANLTSKQADLTALNNLRPYSERYKKANNDFEIYLSTNAGYFTNRQYEKWRKVNLSLAQALNSLSSATFDLQDEYEKILKTFKYYYTKGRIDIDTHNKEFQKREAEAVKPLLKNRSIPYNDEQLRAITSEEDNTLVVAGAGTGKSTTILGKLAYLVDRRHIDTDKILVLSFARRAVDNLNERIKQHFPDETIEARTFHEFGLGIISRTIGKKPSLAFGDDDNDKKKIFISKTFEALLNDRNYASIVAEYFLYYMAMVDLQPRFNTLNEYWQYPKEQVIITFQKERVKSWQEAMIANFLFKNQVKYVYEQPYEADTVDTGHRQYCPDFYLPDYDIYIEHFGVDRHGQVHFCKDESKNITESLKYQQGMAWKRQVHQTNNTKLVETFSYEFNEQNWKQALTDKLISCGVQMKERDASEIIAVLRESDQIRQITKLFITFLDLAKSNGYALVDLQRKATNLREAAFLKVFAPIYEWYHSELARSGTIDFNDMLLQAAEYISTNKCRCIYKYIIIDEFQDFSMSKHRLVKALSQQDDANKLYCVGDDWQSIYRFTGSDISLMTHFEEFNGFTKRTTLTQTNRYNDKLAKITNTFILKNPYQTKKAVIGLPPTQGSALEIIFASKEDEKAYSLDAVLEQICNTDTEKQKPIHVLLLGRYNHNKPANLMRLSVQFPTLTLEFLTVHGSKGKEADYVVVLDVNSGRYGFPSQIDDDPVLELVLSKNEPYPHAEERRLMYVALTRARQKIFIISDPKNKSVFTTEIEEIVSPSQDNLECSECGGSMIERTGPYGPFYGCKNYPECTNKKNI